MHGQRFLFDGGHVSSAARTTLRPIMGLRAIAAIGLAAIPLNDVILKRLLAIVETVRAGDRSSPRTRTVCRRSPGRCCYCSFSGLVIAAIGRAVSTPALLAFADGARPFTLATVERGESLC